MECKSIKTVGNKLQQATDLWALNKRDEAREIWAKMIMKFELGEL